VLETTDRRHVPDEAAVLVVGAGPVGLITSLQLAKHGIRNVLIERNNDTTKWPKMDITNSRSMELLNRLGLADGLREQGTPPQKEHSTVTARVGRDTVVSR
jgi:FAD-dependent monooxygenase